MGIAAFTHPLVGQRVQITRPGYYGKRCLGQKGTIRAFWGDQNIGVDLDFMSNDNSKHGYFYFKLSELDVIIHNPNKTANAAEKEGKTMLKATNYLNVAVIHFLNDDTAFRTFECANYHTDLKEGDLCVVMSAHHGMGLAEVEEIKTSTDKELYREVVDRVDVAPYNTRVEQRAKAAELKAKMQERAKQLQDIVLYQTLMAQLLQDFKDLGL